MFANVERVVKADVMQKCIVRPLPDLGNVPEPANREERLKIIIANLEKQHKDVKASIIAEGWRELQALQDHSAVPEEVDIDTAFAAPSHNKLIANLNAPYDGRGDPCLARNGGARSPKWPPSLSITPSAAEKRIQQQVTERLEAYEKHARLVTQYYLQALERQRGGGSFGHGSGGGEGRRKSVTFAPGS